MLTYFERLSMERSDVPKWEHGAEFVRRWMILLGHERVSQPEFDRLVRDMRREAWAGSGLCDLYRRIHDWAEDLGLEVTSKDIPDHW